MGLPLIAPQPGAGPALLAAPPAPGKRLRVIEVAGLAGAGKSSVTQAVARLDPRIRARPHVSLPWYVASVPTLVPTFVSLHRPFRGVLNKEMKRILRLEALYGLARWTRDGRPLLFDEGPVYMLARILVRGGRRIETTGFARWWRRAVAEWAAILDIVVWLDAPDDVLAARIETRPQWHPIQGAGSDALTAFLRSYRAAYARVLADLTDAADGPQLWTAPTDRGSADLTARALLARLRAASGNTRRVEDSAR